ncbi:MAG: ribosome biogenesis GTP-binding protein YihA/YsxC [Candidatus Xenobium sp.]|nr:YihA family ribosome biogenesis GTP-binding protein [Burkholderiales bacterium]
MKIQRAEFITSAPSRAQAPPDRVLPEVALVGRSNVGKSSFLCGLVGRKGLAKVSSTPGKTRMLNYFLIDERWYLVDLPGYGYAKVSKAEQERWGRAMEDYLSHREGLVLVIQLLDARHGPKASDLQMQGWLADKPFQHLVILTKSDKLSRAQLLRSHRDSAVAMGLSPDDVMLYSSVTGDGREAILKRLGTTLG